MNVTCVATGSDSKNVCCSAVIAAIAAAAAAVVAAASTVSAAGAAFRFTADGIQEAIRDAGFTPKLRNQQYEYREVPKEIIQQELDHKIMVVD